MSVDFDILVKCDEGSIDLKLGVETFEGISDSAVTIIETLATNKVPEKITHRISTRARLEHSFPGSFGQRFKVSGTTQESCQKIDMIGSENISKVISYFIKEALYIEQPEPDFVIKRIIEEFKDQHEELIEKLRVSSLKKSHALSLRNGYEVEFGRRNDLSKIIVFQEATATSLIARRVDERFDIIAAIRRLNTNTGNGRLERKDQDYTVPFGFGVNYSSVDFKMKKLFSSNLHDNNGRDKDEWDYLKIIVEPVKMLDGKIVRYIIKGMHD